MAFNHEVAYRHGGLWPCRVKGCDDFGKYICSLVFFRNGHGVHRRRGVCAKHAGQFARRNNVDYGGSLFGGVARPDRALNEKRRRASLAAHRRAFWGVVDG